MLIQISNEKGLESQLIIWIKQLKLILRKQIYISTEDLSISICMNSLKHS